MSPLILDTPFGFSLDLSFWQDFFSMSYWQIAMAVFAFFVWWLLILFLFKKAAVLWLKTKQVEHLATWQWVTLAVDVPPQFIQSPKAVEQIFVHLSGSFTGYGIYDRYWHGLVNKWFSFEIISIEGYIQFVVRTETHYRDLVEAAIYAQYYEAEITEVEDYTSLTPEKFPNETHDAQGVEFALAENEVYPIRTYPHFEYNISKDVVFSDPMAALLENFSRAGEGENLWLQLVVVPVDNSWKQGGLDLVKEIVSGKKKIKKSGVVATIGDFPMKVAKTALQAWSGNFEAPVKKEEKDSGGKVSDLTPGGRAVVESIEEKISKLGFKSYLRALYVAEKEKFMPHKCMSGMIGAMNQFHTNNRNGFKAKTIGVDAVAAYKSRKLGGAAGDAFILNIEELATVWHFPLPMVKTPLLQKADIKRGEPPINLPVENFQKPIMAAKIETPKIEEESAVPEDLPYA